MFDFKDFIKRLDHLMTAYDLSASTFSKTIGVQRSVISHISSGRNKPSLDFVLRILNSFPEVNFEWLVLGKGNFTNSNSKPLPHDNSKQQDFNALSKFETHTADKKIDKVIIIYSDNSFDSYQ